MAKKDKINIDNTGVDMLEAFMQNNIKMIVILISSLVVLFIAVYLGYTAYGISKNKKIDSLSAAEMIMIDNSSVDTFAALSSTVPSLKDYIAVRSAGMYHMYDNSEKAVSELKKAGGKFSELSAGMLYDLGQNVVPANYLQGEMRELWYYRNVLSSNDKNIDTNINNFKMLYPESQLLTLVENWNIK